MSVNLTVNGSTFAYPQKGDRGWGAAATQWAQAVTSGMLQKAGGSFTLTAEVDFGATYGLKSAYYKSRAANVSSAGVIRLGNTDVIGWRNAANGGNVTLTVNASDQFVFSGSLLPSADATYDLGSGAAQWKDLYLSGSLVLGGGITITGNLTVNGNTTLGNATSDTITFTGRAISSIQPSVDATHNLGDIARKWNEAYAVLLYGENLTVELDATIGSAPTDILTINASVDSDILPLTDSSYDLGSSSAYWANAYIDSITTTGGIVVGGVVSLANGSVGAPSLNFASATTSGLYYVSGSTFAVSANGSAIMRFNGSLAQTEIVGTDLLFNQGASAAAVSLIKNGVTDGVMAISSGTSVTSGRIILLAGSTHATLPSVMQFRAGSTVQGSIDANGLWTLGASGGSETHVVNGLISATLSITSVGGNMTANAFIPAGSSVPTNGMYLPAANTVGIAANSALTAQVEAEILTIFAASTTTTGPILRLRSTDTSIQANELVGAVEFYSNDTSGSGAGVRASISAIAESTSGNSGLNFKVGNTGALVTSIEILSTGTMGLCGTSNTSVAVNVGVTNPLSGSTQAGLRVWDFIASSAATTAVYSFQSRVQTVDSAFTVPIAAAFRAGSAVKGTASTITRYAHLLLDGSLPTVGTGAAYISDTATIGSGNYFIYTTGTSASVFGGSITGASFIPSGSTVPTNGMYLSTTNTVAFATNSTVRVTLDSSTLFSNRRLRLIDTSDAATVIAAIGNRSASANGVLTSTQQTGLAVDFTASSNAIVAVYGIKSFIRSEAASFTVPIAANFRAEGMTVGVGSTITRFAHILLDGALPTVGTGAAYISDTATIGSASYFIYSTSTNTSLFSGVVNCSAGVRTKYSTANTANPPTDAELDSAFGAPATLGSGFIGILNDNGANTNEYICWTDGTTWFYVAGTLAT